MKTRQPIRRCGKQYATEEEAFRSKAGQKPGAEVTSCRCGKVHVTKPALGRARLSVAKIAATRKPVKPVSAKRQAENRDRRAMVAAMFGGERPLCFVPWCGQWADDLHEPLSRARGGSITDPANATPLCRPHHDQVTFRPESELGWAYELGLLIHSWNADGADAA